LQALGVGEPLALLLQLRHLARFKARLVQLLALESDQRQLALALLPLGGQQGVTATQLAHLGGEVEILLPVIFEVAVGVEELELIGGLQEGDALALAVNVNEEIADLLERRYGDGLIVDVGLTASAAVETARQDQVVLIEFRFEDALDLGARVPRR